MKLTFFLRYQYERLKFVVPSSSIDINNSKFVMTDTFVADRFESLTFEEDALICTNPENSTSIIFWKIP